MTDPLKLANDAFLVGAPLWVAVGAAIALNCEFIAATVSGDPGVAISMLVFGVTVPFAVVFTLTTAASTEGFQVPGLPPHMIQPVSQMLLVIAIVVLILGQFGCINI